MIIPDANLLIYAQNESLPQHQASRRWLEDSFMRTDPVGFAWMTLWAMLRISTNVKVFPSPLKPTEVFEDVRKMLERPNAVIVQPGPRHLQILEGLVHEAKTPGPHITDIALAAIAIEHGAILASNDRGFRRFPGLRWINPLD